jgi:sugar phosphate isomerase/epimerase
MSTFADRIGLSPVAIPRCGFEEAFETAAEAGFKGISLRYDRVEAYLAEGHTLEDVHALLRRFGLRFAEAGFLAEWMFRGGMPLVCGRKRQGGPEETNSRLLRRLHTFFRTCAEFECFEVTAAPALHETGPLDQAAEDLGALCDVARPYGVRICLEFFGKAPQVSDIASAQHLIAATGRDNAGILVDTFFFHEGGSRIADLDAVPIERIFNVQLADAAPKPLQALDMLADRVYPGEGAAPVAEVAAALIRRGYSGFWTVELFNPEYFSQSPREVARQAYATAAATLEKATRAAGTGSGTAER